MSRPKKVSMVVEFTEGWKERVTKASYELYIRQENKEKKKQIV